jgi:hypothetical protein
MKMWWRMISVEYRNHNSEKSGDLRHIHSLPPNNSEYA